MASMPSEQKTLGNFAIDESLPDNQGAIKSLFAMVSTDNVSTAAKKLWLLMIADSLSREKGDRSKLNLLQPKLITNTFGQSFQKAKVLKATEELQTTIISEVRQLGNSTKEITNFQLCGTVKALVTGESERLTAYSYVWPEEMIHALNNDDDSDLLIDFRAVNDLQGYALELWLRCFEYVDTGATPWWDVREFVESVMGIKEADRRIYHRLYRNSQCPEDGSCGCRKLSKQALKEMKKIDKEAYLRERGGCDKWDHLRPDLEMDWDAARVSIRRAVNSINASKDRVFNLSIQTDSGRGRVVQKIRLLMKRESVVLLPSKTTNDSVDQQSLQAFLVDYFKDISLIESGQAAFPSMTYDDNILLMLMGLLGVRSSVSEQVLKDMFDGLQLDASVKARQVIELITAVFNQLLEDKIQKSAAAYFVHLSKHAEPKFIEQEVEAFRRRFAVTTEAMRLQRLSDTRAQAELTDKQALTKLKGFRRQRMLAVRELMKSNATDRSKLETFDKEFLGRLVGGTFGKRYQRWATPLSDIDDYGSAVLNLGRAARLLYEIELLRFAHEEGLLGEATAEDIHNAVPGIASVINKLNREGHYTLDELINAL